MCLECTARANASALRCLGRRTARPQQVESARPPGERNGPASKADVFRRGSPSLTWGVIFSTKEGGLCGDGMRDPQTLTEPGGQEVWGG